MARTSFPLSASEVLLMNSLSALGDTGVNEALKKSGNSIVNGNITGSLTYQGTWNATTNTPALASGVGTLGYYYYVSVAGSTNIDGITDWQIGDMLLFNGTAWQKVDNTDAVTSVAGMTGAVVLSLDNLTDVAITGVASGEFLRYNGTNFVNTTIGASDIPSGIDATKIGNGDVTNTELSYIASATGTTGTGNIVFSATPTFTGGILFSDSISSVSTNSVDGSDSKAITIAGGGAYGPTRGSGIAVIGNEYAAIGGDLELMAGDSSVSGAIKHYVGNGAGGAYLALKTERTTGLTSFYGGIDCLALTQLRYAVTIGGNATADAVGLEIGNTAGGTPYIDFKRSAVDYDVRIINGTSTTLSFLGGTGGYGFDGPFVLTGDHAVGSISTSSRIQNNANNGLVLQGAGTTNDMLVVNSAGNNVFRIPVAGTNVRFYSAPEPSSNDGASIGTASRSFSDYFIASGGVINWNNGDYTMTHSTGNLTFSGTLTVTATKQLVSSASIYNYVDISNASGNLVASSRGSIFLDVDADNTSTANTLFVRFNGTTYTGIFEEDGALTLGGTAKSGTGALYSGKIQVGGTAPTFSAGSALTINTDVTTGAAGSASIMIQGSSNKERLVMVSAGGGSLINMFSHAGSIASPTATQNGYIISGLSGGGYKATGYSGNQYVFIQYATENWTDTATGCYTAFFTVPNGSTSLTGRLLINHDGAITFGAAFGTGTGALYAGAGTFTGLLTTVASASGGAGLRIPHGTAPSSATNGDVWTTTAGAFIRINGVTKTFTLT